MCTNLGAVSTISTTPEPAARCWHTVIPEDGFVPAAVVTRLVSICGKLSRLPQKMLQNLQLLVLSQLAKAQSALDSADQALDKCPGQTKSTIGR